MSLQNAVRNTPKPPTPPKPHSYRSFVKIDRRKVYLIDGVEFNPVEVDTKEAFEVKVAEYMQDGAPEGAARARAYKEREERLGIGKEHGFYGEQVEPWFPGNTAVLVGPILWPHANKYYSLHGETLDNFILKVMTVTQNLLQIHSGAQDEEGNLVQPFPIDPAMGCMNIPGLGPMYGTLDMNQTELVGFVLSCHGKVVGKQPSGQYITEEITEEEVLRLLPHGFIHQVVDEESNRTVFDEVMDISTLINYDLILDEMKKDDVIKDDEVKN